MNLQKNNAAQARGGIQSQQEFVSDNYHHNSYFKQDQQQVSTLETFESAQKFLTLLDEDTDDFTFQTFDDDSKRKDTQLAKILHGTLDQHYHELCRLQKRGAGVFVTVNRTDGTGRKTENIKKVRAVFVDLDGNPLDPVIGASLTPHILVESSPRRFHAYWLIDDLPLEHFSIIQKALIKMFEADPSVNDLPRVMRLPGFIHQKGNAFQTRILETSGGLPYKAEDLLSAFKILMEGNKNSKGIKEENSVLKSLQKTGLLHEKDSMGQGRWNITCPWKHLHTTAGGTAHYFEPHTNGYVGHGFKCFHAHCIGRIGRDLLDFLGINSGKTTGSESIWKKPIPLPEELPPVAVFNEVLLPDATRAWILDIAERMQIPPDFSAASSMVVAASLIGRRCGIYPKEKDDWLVVPNLWGAIIGRPSLLKSPAIAEIIKPLDHLITNAQEEYKNERKLYEKRKLVQEAQKGALKDKLKKAAKENSSEESLQAVIEQNYLSEESMEKAQSPTERRYKTEDGTVQKIGEILKENPHGILIHRDELTGWLRSLDMYGREGDRAFYLESWNGSGSFTVDRIGRGTLHIPALCLSILGGIQPGPLSSYVYQANSSGSGDDGLMQRFQMIVWPDAPKSWVNVDRWPDTKAKNRAYQVFKMLANLKFTPENEEDIPALHFDPLEAQLVFNEWREKLEKKLRDDNLPSSLESHLAKYRSLMPSIALTLYLIDTLDAEKSIGQVSEDCALRAVLWCEYLESHSYRLYSAAQNPAIESARELLKHIQKGGVDDRFSPRDIYRHQWSKLTTPDETREAIKVLVDYGWIILESQKPETYRLHPSVRRTP